jgi:hypothetical protein
VDELFRLNPGAREGIAEGQVLTIPQRGLSVRKKKRTIVTIPYFLKRRSIPYRKTIPETEDVMRANPGLSVETFQIGKTIRIPFFESYEVILPYEEQTLTLSIKSAGEKLSTVCKTL